MAVDERARHALHERLDQVLGSDEAVTLMSHLPPVGWADVATRRDVDGGTVLLRSEFQREMAGLRDELRGEMAGLRDELRGEMAGLRDELRGEMAELRGETREGFAELRTAMADQRAEFKHDLATLTRTFMISMITAVMAAAGLAFSAARFM